MKRVTSWSAETSDGTWYAERIHTGSQYWRLLKIRGRKQGFYGKHRGFDKVCAAANAAMIAEVSDRHADALKRLADR